MREGAVRLAASAEGAGHAASWASVRSMVGELTVVASTRGVLRIAFDRPACVLAPYGELGGQGAIAAEVGKQLAEYFEGRRRGFDVPIDWSGLEGFRCQVLRTLQDRVPFGTTVTYQQLAELSGRRTAARSVGVIMGSNPVPVVVPCHRVVASGGSLGGYGPGIEAKRRLLTLEGVLGPTLWDAPTA